MLTITNTIPPGRELLNSECAFRIDKATGKPILPEKMMAVYFSGTPACVGVIPHDVKGFVMKYWTGKKITHPANGIPLEVTFVSTEKTYHGTVADYVEYATA